MTVTPIVSAQSDERAVYPLRLKLQVPDKLYQYSDLKAKQDAFFHALESQPNVRTVAHWYAARMLDRLVRPKFETAMCRAYKDLLVSQGHDISQLGKPMGASLSVIKHQTYDERAATLLWTSAHSMGHTRQDIPVATVRYRMTFRPIKRIDRLIVERAEVDGCSHVDAYAERLRFHLLNIRLRTWAAAFLDKLNGIICTEQNAYYYCLPDTLSIAVQPGVDQVKELFEAVRSLLQLYMRIPSRWIAGTVMIQSALASPAVLAQTNVATLHDMVDAACNAEALAMLLKSKVYNELIKKHELVNDMIRQSGEAVAAACVAQEQFAKLQQAIQEQADAQKLARVFFSDVSGSEVPF